MNRRINVKVKPNARVNSIVKNAEDSFEVKVTVPPEKGKANDKVIELLADYFKVPKSFITLVSGQSYKQKVFEIQLKNNLKKDS
jgi:uncharacterized protein (TIGR00251 family)